MPLFSPKSTFQAILAGGTDRGTVRPNNEDALLFYNLTKTEKLNTRASEATIGDQGVLLLVSDGMGGANAGEVASQLATDTFVECLQNALDGDEKKPGGKEIPTLMKTACVEAHKKILETAQAEPEKQGMGATLTAVWLMQTKAWWVHIGDTRLYHLNKESIVQITSDHTPVWKNYQEGLLTFEEARNHPTRNLLDQALGAELEEIHPDTGCLTLEKEDCLLLTTDGLTDAVDNATLYELVSERAKWSLPTAYQYLNRHAREVDGVDNITIALCRITEQES